MRQENQTILFSGGIYAFNNICTNFLERRFEYLWLNHK